MSSQRRSSLQTGPIETINVGPASDGDPTKWPAAGLRPEDPAPYLFKLASKYMQEKGLAIPGHRYTLDRLPSGYALYGKTRGNDPTHIDRYLYGHPKYMFRSVEEFYPHFCALMDNGGSVACTCIGCGGKKRGRPSSSLQSAANTSTRQTAPKLKPKADNGTTETPIRNSKMDFLPRGPSRTDIDEFDEDGTPDVYQQLITALEHNSSIDLPITEGDSFDWLIDRLHLKTALSSARNQPAYIPRRGEIVLFRRNDSDDTWEAGVVTDLPVDLPKAADLWHDQSREYGIGYAGFRVEPCSLAGSADKSSSKRTAQVYLHQIRPFNFYREVITGLRPKNYHVTVHNALAVTSSLSLIERYHFKGAWPEATVFCRGLWLGSEMILVGDAVKLLPDQDQSADEVFDVLHITSIKFKLLHLDAGSNADYDDYITGQSAQREYDCCIHVDGIQYTRDRRRAWGLGKVPLDQDSLPESLRGHEDWYRSHDPVRRWSVPFSRIIGRCFENEAMTAWFPGRRGADRATNLSSTFSSINLVDGKNRSGRDSHVSKGLDGVREARNFSRSRDQRIVNAEKQWFWADSRVEQLDLQEVKSFVTGPFLDGKPSRNVKALRKAMQIRMKGAGHRAKHLPATSKMKTLVSTKKPASGNLLVASSAVGGPIETLDDDAAADEVDDGDYGDAMDLDNVPARAIVEIPSIDPRDIQVISSGESSEVESEIE